MPVNEKALTDSGTIYQRQQYDKGGVGRLYWDYRDKMAMRYIGHGKILDIGCGEGITLEKIIHNLHIKDIIGIDCFQENVEICKRHNLPEF